MFNIIENRRWYLLIAGVLLILSVVALIASAAQLGQPLGLSPDSTDIELAKAAGLTALTAVIIAALLAWWFLRDTPNAFRYGVYAIAVSFFSLLVTCGFYALMGILARWKADTLFFVAVLAVVGFATQDMIVILDRWRENIFSRKTEPYERAANRTILGVLGRNLAARLCIVFVLVALLLLGGTTLRPPVATGLVGVVSETYAATFVAVPLLVAWEKASSRRAAQGTT